MTLPILYKANETDFSTLGLGVLNDNTEALVTEHRNGGGEYVLKMKYPTNGKLFHELKNDRLIKADASQKQKNQRFKIVRITKPTNNVVTIYADHVSYHADELQLKPEVSYSGNAHLALNAWGNNIVDDHEFTTYSDIEHSASGTWKIDRVKSARKALLGTAGSILDVYGGEFLFDNYHIQLLQNRGVDDGALIAYGKNLISLEQEEQIANTFTSVYPYSVILHEDGTEELITLPEYYIDSEHVENFARRKIMLLDLSEEEIDNIDDLRSRTQSYIEANNVGVPSINMKVLFIDLAKTQNYNHMKVVEEINLCDWVTVYLEKFDVRRRAKVIKTVWNCNLDRYEEIELGEARATLSERINTTVDSRVERVVQQLNTVQLAADGKTKIFRGPEEPLNANENDVWFKPSAEGGSIMKIFNGSIWETEGVSGETIAGTINFESVNAINFIADNISGGRLNLANDLQITNGDQIILHVDPQSGEVVGNFSKLQLNFSDVATIDDLENIELTEGPEGKNAYELAVEEGFEGTLQEWINSLKGSDGESGNDGSDGVSIVDVIAQYAVNNSMTTAPTSGWEDTMATRNENEYIWRKDIIHFSNGGTTETAPVMMTGDKGSDGQKGDIGSQGPTGPQGRSITSVDLEYYLSTSKDTQTGGSWVTSPPSWLDGRYMWTRTRTKFSSGNDALTTPVNVTGSRGSVGPKGPTGSTGSQGPTGSTGATGRSVDSLQTEYYLSNSKTERTGGSWSTNQPTWEKGKYVWTRIRINLTNPSGVDYTDPDVDASWEAIDGIEIGGRNLFSTTRWMTQETRSGYYEILSSGELSILKTDGMNQQEYYTLADLIPNTEYVMSFSQPINDRFNLRNENDENVQSLTWNINTDNTELRFKTPDTGVKIVGKFFPVSQEYPVNVFVQIEKGNKATDWTEAPEDLDGRKADSNTVDEINENLSNLETVTATREELGEILSTLNDYKDMIEANEIDVNDAKTNIADLLGRVPAIENNLGEWVEQWNFLDTYIRMGDEGLLIQEKTGSTGIRITTNRIDFLDGRGEPVAYITNQVMRINRGIFVDSAQIGEHKIETISGGHTIWQWMN